MGHEYVHVGQFYTLGAGAFNSSLAEYGSYHWEEIQIAKIGFNSSDAQRIAHSYMNGWQEFFKMQYKYIQYPEWGLP